MVAYEFYWLDPGKGYHLIGTLSEKRSKKNNQQIGYELGERDFR